MNICIFRDVMYQSSLIAKNYMSNIAKTSVYIINKMIPFRITWKIYVREVEGIKPPQLTI